MKFLSKPRLLLTSAQQIPLKVDALVGKFLECIRRPSVGKEELETSRNEQTFVQYIALTLG